MSDVTVIRLDEPENHCVVCSFPADGKLSVPMFEGDVLPNDWEGEWAGFDACRPCFDIQTALRSPMSHTAVATLARPDGPVIKFWSGDNAACAVICSVAVSCRRHQGHLLAVQQDRLRQVYMAPDNPGKDCQHHWFLEPTHV